MDIHIPELWVGVICTVLAFLVVLILAGIASSRKKKRSDELDKPS